MAEKWIAVDWGLNIVEAEKPHLEARKPGLQRGSSLAGAPCRTPANWKQPKYPAEGIGLINDGTLVQEFHTAVHICDDRLLTARNFVFGLWFSENLVFKLHVVIQYL